MDFLWHAVSDKEKEEIKRQAKQIMDSFSGKLEKVEKLIKENPLIEREKCEREEGENCSDNFSREIMFSNAPNKNDDFIIGEKKGW